MGPELGANPLGGRPPPSLRGRPPLLPLTPSQVSLQLAALVPTWRSSSISGLPEARPPPRLPGEDAAPSGRKHLPSAPAAGSLGGGGRKGGPWTRPCGIGTRWQEGPRPPRGRELGSRVVSSHGVLLETERNMLCPRPGPVVWEKPRGPSEKAQRVESPAASTLRGNKGAKKEALVGGPAAPGPDPGST